jgi:hypothetical protein
MPRLSQKARPAAPANGNGAGSQAPTPANTANAAAAVPFVASAHEYTENAFTIVRQIDGAQHQEQARDIPAYGFYRSMFLEVVGTGAVIGEGVTHPDFPFNVIATVSMEDVNSTPIMGPLTGWQLLYANIINGNVFQQDPRRNPLYVSGSATGNFAFYLRIPQEIYHHNAMGCLPNENASSTYKVKITTESGTVLFTTAPTTLPSVSITATLEAWTQPSDTNYEGTPQAQDPPAVGTAQFFSANTQAINVGANNPQLKKVGNLIRSVVIECRNGAGLRDDTVFPNPFRLTWDQRNIYNHSQAMQKTLQWERLTNLAVLDAGMFILSFDHLNMGRQGDGDPFLWWPTIQSSRIEIAGNSATAGTITYMTNDIAPAEIMPSERYVLTSQTGFHPAMYAGNPTTN